MAKQLWGIAVVLSIIAAAMFGTLKAVEAQSQAKCHFEPGAASLVAESGCTIDIKSGASLEIDTGSTFSISGTTVSGPVRFGSQAAATDGITITHGLGTTPTSVVISPEWGDNTVTQTVYVSQVGASTFSIEFTNGAVTNTTIYWIAGR